MTTATKVRGVNVAAATKAVNAHKGPSQTIYGVLAAIGAPANATNVANVSTWLSNEQTPTTYWANRGNPFGVQTSSALSSGRRGDTLGGVIATAHLLTTSSAYAGIVTSLRSSAPSSIFNHAVVNSPWNGSRHYSGVDVFASKGSVTLSNPTGWFGQWVEPVLTGSVVGLKNNPIVPITNAAIAPIKATVSLGSFISKLTSKNVGIFAGGAVLTVVGLVLFVVTSKEGHALEGAAVKAV